MARKNSIPMEIPETSETSAQLQSRIDALQTVQSELCDTREKAQEVVDMLNARITTYTGELLVLQRQLIAAIKREKGLTD